MLPTFLRRRRLFAFCRAMCSPLYLGEDGLYNRFLQNRGDHIYRLSHNSQVCYLRAALNEAFGLTKGFEITDAEDYEGEWIYVKDPSMPQQLHAVDESKNPTDSGDSPPTHPTPLLADEGRLNNPGNSFIVRVPGNIYTTQLDKVKAIVEQYRIPSKTPIYTSTVSNYEQSGISIDISRKRWQWPLSIVNTRTIIPSGSNIVFAGAMQDWR